jgi:alcohol dehydrogenase
MMEPAIQSLRIGGHLVLIGSVFPVPPITLLPEQIIRRQLTIRGYHNYRTQHLLEAVQFLKSSCNRFPFSELISTWYPLSEISSQAVAGFPSSEVRIGVTPNM